MTFQEYVTDWFHEFVEQHEDNTEWCEDLFQQLDYNKDEHLDEDETCYDFLMAMSDADEIYEALFGCNAKATFVDDLPDTEDFLTTMFKEVGRYYMKEYDFAEELFEDMAGESEGYVTPIGFFEDLECGGCASGMIGMFIYNADCKKFYVDHIDSMEDYFAELEGDMGCPIENKNKLPHYTFICWLCYEELAHNIAKDLWPDTF